MSHERGRTPPKWSHFDGAAWPRPTFGSVSTLTMTDDEKAQAKEREEAEKPPFGFVAPNDSQDRMTPEERVRHCRRRTEW